MDRNFLAKAKLYRTFRPATSFIAVLFSKEAACQGWGEVLRLRLVETYCPETLEKLMEFNFEQVHNYYERLIFEEVARRSEEHQGFTSDMLADVACVALNRLPARYVRHDVDMLFYLTEQERQVIAVSMDEVLKFAFVFVKDRASKQAF
jgi:hypothetical protein